jgi:hypothetical protein
MAKATKFSSASLAFSAPRPFARVPDATLSGA